MTEQLVGYLKSTFLFFDLQSMWFIPVYFYSALIYDLQICKHKNKIKMMVVVIASAILLVGHLKLEHNLVYRMIGKVVEALVFIQTGCLFHRFQDNTNKRFIIVCFALFSILGICNGFVSMNFEFGRIPMIFFVNTSVLSISICYIFKTISHCFPQIARSILPIYGQYSVVTLVTNNIIIGIIRLLDYKISGNFFLNNGYEGYFLFAIILILLEYPIILVEKGKQTYCLGKEKK